MPAWTNPELLGFDDIPPSEPPFKPYKISTSHRAILFQGVPESVKEYARQKQREGWKFYAVDQDRGRCYHGSKVITIPTWTIDRRSLDYRVWYISHELSHAFAGWKAHHGPDFMEWLKRICPADCVHHELGYKPRNAAAAGIRKPGEIDIFDL